MTGETTELSVPADYGFTGDSTYLLRFAGGSPVGAAVQYDAGPHTVVLGDPTIRLTNRPNQGISYDSTVGQQFFSDPKGAGIKSLTHFDFNRDGREDVAALTNDGRVRLFLAEASGGTYRDRGDLAYLADPPISMVAMDFSHDGYDDLIVGTEGGRLVILNNDAEVITRFDHPLNVGKQLYQLLSEDMDRDGFNDLITVDSLGDVRIFYNQSEPGRLFGPQEQIPVDGQLIGEYGLHLRVGENMGNEVRIRFSGLPEPTSRTASAPTVRAPSPQQQTYLSNYLNDPSGATVSRSDAENFLADQEARVADARQTNTLADALLLPWQEQDASDTYFAPSADYTRLLSIQKTVEPVSRPTATNVDRGEVLRYRLAVTARDTVRNLVLADALPDLLALNPDSPVCESGACGAMKTTARDVYLFFSNVSLEAGQSMVVSYEATVQTTPIPKVVLQRYDGTTALQNNRIAPVDDAIDLLISPPYNASGDLVLHYSVEPRRYEVASTVSAVAPEWEDGEKALNDCQDALNALTQSADPARELARVNALCGSDEAMESIRNGFDPTSGQTPPTPEECGLNPDRCSQSIMEDIAGVISGLSCSGGGCFPVPYNTAFLVPSPPTPIPLPVFAAPVVYNPLIPVWPPTPPLPAEGSGSVIRFYASPTLTGGVGLALCWGPYTGSVPVPPPIFPVPYPPPIGNCLTYAIPISNAPQCRLAKDAITKAMELANSVVSDVQSGITALNSSGVPASVRTSDQQGTGGLEVSLAVNLGGSQTFTPPLKGVSNVHVGAFDSIGGVISSWVDRQLLEITNKLLDFPSIRVQLPDLSNAVGDD
ncbi:VCBS repeat-containing protein [Candidatus Peregrinibacteria bacterium]|nr:MAG: VCBS repeat-containing protein [Candidatus Peregrinibacteria bacterium]